MPAILKHTPVGAAEGCDLLICAFENQHQKIAAFGSSYTGLVFGGHKKSTPQGASFITVESY
jgi:hypothetical protein